MSKFTKGQLFRVTGNSPANPAGEHSFSVGEVIQFIQIDRDGDYQFESLIAKDRQCVLPQDVELIDSSMASVWAELKAVTAEVAALRAQIEEVLAAKTAEVAAESVERQKDRPVTREDVCVGARFRVAFKVDGNQHNMLEIGDIVEIVQDDGDNCPKVRLLTDDDVWTYCSLSRLAHIEKPAPKVGNLFRVLRDGRTQSKGCWFNYGAGTIVELIELLSRDDDVEAAIFRQVGGTPNDPPDYSQIIWFVDLEPYNGPIPATEISQDAARQMLATLKELVSKAEAVIAKTEGRK